MNATQQRIVGVMLAGWLVTACGCSTTATQPGSILNQSRADFAVVFSPGSNPTSVTIDPQGGDAEIRYNHAGGKRDNKVVWKSEQPFAVRFEDPDNSSLPPKRPLGDETEGWNPAKEVRGVWRYKLKLKQDVPGAENMAKYSLKHATAAANMDPVLIIRY